MITTKGRARQKAFTLVKKAVSLRELLNRIAQNELATPRHSIDNPYEGHWACGHSGTAFPKSMLQRMAQVKCPACRRR